MTDYTLIIEGIHSETGNGGVTDEHGYITIDEKRQLTPPEGFNPIIAYAGDINSQIVSFLCPIEYDGHSLRDCSNHEIRWYNSGSGIGDTSELEVVKTDIDSSSNQFVMHWAVPPEAVTKNGMLSVVITIYDKVNGVIKYQWNTAPFKSLSVGETMENVDVKIPTTDKILTLNPYTRNITLPVGYNTTIAMQGDVGTTEVYIQAPRYIAGIDLCSQNTKVYINWTISTYENPDLCEVKELYSQVEKDDLALILWKPHQTLINNSGQFSFEISIKEFDDVRNIRTVKQWYSNTNTSLSIQRTLNISEDIQVDEGTNEIILVDKENLITMLEEEFGYKEV